MYQDIVIVFCKHPECPYNDCGFNQSNYSFDCFDKDVWYVDFGCNKYLDI